MLALMLLLVLMEYLTMMTGDGFGSDLVFVKSRDYRKLSLMAPLTRAMRLNNFRTL